MDLEKKTIEHGEKLASLQTTMNTTCRKVDKILDNHLPHIQNELTEFKEETRVELGTIKGLLQRWGGVIALLSFLIPILVGIFLHML